MQKNIELKPNITNSSLIGLSLLELEKLVLDLGLEKFRAQQIFKWIYAKSTRDWEQMTDLGTKAREILKSRYTVGSLSVAKHQISVDGTQKFLFKTTQGDHIESVLMAMTNAPELAKNLSKKLPDARHASPSERSLLDINEYRKGEHNNTDGTSQAGSKTRFTACISSQVGCAVRCPFCATGTLGFQRNLSADEIIEQVLLMQNISGERIDNLVFMGQGEPLNNYDNVLESIHKFRNLVGIGVRHITVSTSGVVPAMLKLAEEGLQVTLALSLHDPEDEGRDYLVPINRKWPVAEIIAALENFVNKTNRRVTIEYAMIRDLNDSPHKAKTLAKLVQKLHCNINLIPYNQTDVNAVFQRSEQGSIRQFAKILEEESRGKTVTIRKERGHDIDAACGQLANK